MDLFLCDTYHTYVTTSWLFLFFNTLVQLILAFEEFLIHSVLIVNFFPFFNFTAYMTPMIINNYNTNVMCLSILMCFPVDLLLIVFYNFGFIIWFLMLLLIVSLLIDFIWSWPEYFVFFLLIICYTFLLRLKMTLWSQNVSYLPLTFFIDIRE